MLLEIICPVRLEQNANNIEKAKVPGQQNDPMFLSFGTAVV